MFLFLRESALLLCKRIPLKIVYAWPASIAVLQCRGQGTERADTGTASVCGKANKKIQTAASLTSGCGAPFWRSPAAHGSKRGPAPGKSFACFCCGTTMQGQGTERADTGTASVCGKATKKIQMAAILTSGYGAPF